jgi:hypothetical protein
LLVASQPSWATELIRLSIPHLSGKLNAARAVPRVRGQDLPAA